MSDDPRVVQRNMKKIFISNDSLLDLFHWLARVKVGMELALVSRRFDRVADKNLGSRKWTLGNLWIDKGQNGAIIIKNSWDINQEEKKEYLPLAEGALPEYVVGFKHIRICYVDHKVIGFLCRIRRLFQPKNNGDGIGLAFDLHCSQVRSWDVFFDSIWPLINASAITTLLFADHSFGNFLFDLPSVRAVDLHRNNELCGEKGQSLRQWLNTPRADGKPKFLKNYPSTYASNLVAHMKTAFVSAKTTASFIITIEGCYYTDNERFKLDNWCTGERLEFRKGERVARDYWLLERGPIEGRDAKQWAKWGEEAMDGEKHNMLILSFYDHVIGPLDGIAGPSGQSKQK